MPARTTTTGRLTRPPVESWVVVDARSPGPFGAGDAVRLATVYWRSARTAMAGLVRPVGDVLGPVELRVLSTGGPVLIRTAPARVDVTEAHVHVTFPILGGLAVGAAGGRLLLTAERTADGLRLGVRVDGYTPRLYRPRRLPARMVAVPYALVQNAVHDHVTRRYLAALGEGRR